jgi:carotenoid cleavage dioxygenase
MTSRYLQANFAPVTDEIDVFDLEVEGSIPESLTGRYVRSGPNPIDRGDVEHWFVGDGMLHGVRLRGGEAEWYRNRWVTSSVAAAHKGIPEVDGPSNGLDGSGNTNVVHHAGRIVALNEVTMPFEITPELETVARIDFGGPLPAGLTAHPKFDPDTGEMHAMAYFFTEPFLRYHVVDPSGQLVRTEVLDVGGPVMVHDMGLTETKVIAFDLPVLFDLDVAMSGVRLPYRWKDDYPARIGVMPRGGTGSDTTWIDIDPCFLYHPLNAYDDGDSVVIDVVRYDTMFKTDVDGPTDTVPRLDRWTIDLTARKVLSETVDDRAQEFPRADERLATKRHRYGYATGMVLAEQGGGPERTSAILKHDFDAGTTSEHPMGRGRTAGEFVFVPADEAAGEDEGWLMGYVYDAATDTSDLVILDAHDFGVDPIATVHLPRRVPAGFHGNWIPDTALD